MIQKIRQNPIAVIFVLIFLFAFGIRLIEINKYNLWLDECISVFFANKSLHECIVSKFDIQTLLYNISLCIWVKVFGIGPLAARSLSLIFGMLSVILVYFVAEKMFKNKIVSLTAMLLLALNPMCIHFSCEVRAYSMLCFGVLFSFCCLLNYLDKQNIKNTILYTASIIILVYTHSFGWIFLFIETLFALIQIIKTGKRNLLKNWLLIQMVVLVFATYIVYMVIKNFKSMTTTVGWIKQPDFGILLKTFYELSGSDWVAKIFSILIIIYLFVLVFRNYKKTYSSISFILFLTIWILFPLLLIYFYSIYYHSIFLTRYFIICIPPLILLTAYIINNLTGNTILKYTAISIISLLLLFRINLNNDLSKTYNEPWKKICEDIRKNKNGKEIIIIEPYFNIFPFTYYYARDYFCSAENIFSNTMKFDTYTFFTPEDFESKIKNISGNVWLVIYGKETLNNDNKIYNYFKENKNVVYEWQYPEKYSLNVFYFQ